MKKINDYKEIAVLKGEDFNKININKFFDKINKVLSGIDEKISFDVYSKDIYVKGLGFIEIKVIDYIQLDRIIDEDEKYLLSIKGKGFHLMNSFRKLRGFEK